MVSSTLRFFVVLVFCIVTFFSSQAQITLKASKEDGVFKSGETATWTITLKDKLYRDSVRYSLKSGDLIIVSEGTVVFEDTISYIHYTFTEPGSIILEVRWSQGESRSTRMVGGAIADPENLKLSSPRPQDFDNFWESKIKELAAIPINAVLTKDDCETPGVDYFKISMDNIRGSKIYGQLARPNEGEKFPALLVVQWAGVYPLQKSWVIDRAKPGWLVLNINPHELPIDNAPQFYKDQSMKELKDYWAIGNDNRETSYFLWMYLSCYRAAEYLTKRPDWDGKTLVATGDSQGGLQALMTAGLFPGITACMALVPAGFDMLGPEIGRKGGWPQWYNNVQGKDSLKAREASRYYDVANFIPRIKCPVLVGIGLLDETCPPSGIIAGLNQLESTKEIILLPNSGHQDVDGSQRPYRERRDMVWLPALYNGTMVPLSK